jgi:hypothetical protein
MRTLTLALLVFCLPASAGSIYQCRDDKGKVTLQDSPCVNSQPERVVPSGQDLARERYLQGDPTQALGRSIAYSAICGSTRTWYDAARRSADAAAVRGNLAEMQRANESVQQAGQRMSEQGC